MNAEKTLQKLKKLIAGDETLVEMAKEEKCEGGCPNCPGTIITEILSTIYNYDDNSIWEKAEEIASICIGVTADQEKDRMNPAQAYERIYQDIKAIYRLADEIQEEVEQD